MMRTNGGRSEQIEMIACYPLRGRVLICDYWARGLRRSQHGFQWILHVQRRRRILYAYLVTLYHFTSSSALAFATIITSWRFGTEGPQYDCFVEAFNAHISIYDAAHEQSQIPLGF